MPYFQNVFDQEFRGNLVLSDRQYSVSFSVKPNVNTAQIMTAWNTEPWNITNYSSLTFNYSFDSGNSWSTFSVDVTTNVANTNAALTYEVVNALNGNSTFAALFNASSTVDKIGDLHLVITSSRPRTAFISYISNGGAESILRFNKRAGVAELPTYFARHTIANQPFYPDSVGLLIQLDPTSLVGQQIINEACTPAGVSLNLTYSVGVTNSGGTATIPNTVPFAIGDSVVVYDGSTYLSTTISDITTNTSLTLTDDWTGTTEIAKLIDIHADYQLLRGRSGIFNFQNITVDDSDRITQIIEYAAGNLPGDLARLIQYVYTGSNTHPSQITEVPYTLTAADLVIPPS
jgi:hypothetical protein